MRLLLPHRPTLYVLCDGEQTTGPLRDFFLICETGEMGIAAWKGYREDKCVRQWQDTVSTYCVLAMVHSEIISWWVGGAKERFCRDLPPHSGPGVLLSRPKICQQFLMIPPAYYPEDQNQDPRTEEESKGQTPTVCPTVCPEGPRGQLLSIFPMLQPEDIVHVTDADHHFFWVSLLYCLTYWINTLEL